MAHIRMTAARRRAIAEADRRWHDEQMAKSPYAGFHLSLHIRRIGKIIVPVMLLVDDMPEQWQQAILATGDYSAVPMFLMTPPGAASLRRIIALRLYHLPA